MHVFSIVGILDVLCSHCDNNSTASSLLLINFTRSALAVSDLLASPSYYGLWMWFPELFSRVEKYGGSPCDHHQGPPNRTGNSTQEVDKEWVYFSGFLTALSNLPGNLLTIFLMDQLGRKLLLCKEMFYLLKMFYLYHNFCLIFVYEKL